MATDAETLLVQMRADTRSYERAMAQAVASTEANTRRIERQFEKTNASVARAVADMRRTVSGGLGGLDAGKLLGGAAMAVAGKQITDLADRWQEATNKIKAAGLDDLGAKVAIEGVAGIADRARTDFASTADLYARLTRAGAGFGATQAEVAVATEVVAKSLKLTGASAQETESTLIQLGQALTSGRLQGDELRSLSENAPVVAKAIASAFGVAVGDLKTLGAEGKLTADRVFRAIVDAQPEVERQFATTSATVADGFRRIETAAVKFVGTSSSANGAVAALSSVLNGAATNFDTLAGGAVALGALLASRLVAAGLAPAVAAFGATVAGAATASGAMTAAGAASARAAPAFAGAALAARGLGAGLLTLAGGPVGLMIFGLVTIIGVFAARAAEGAASSKTYAAALAEVETRAGVAAAAVAKVGSAVEQTNRKMQESKVKKIEEDLGSLDSQVARTNSVLGDLVRRFESANSAKISREEKEAALEAIRAAMSGTAEDAVRARETIERLGQANPTFATATERIARLIGDLVKLQVHARSAHDALARIRVEQDNEQAAARARDDQNALFKAGVQPVSAPEPSRTLARLAADREVVLAEMDETKRRIQDKAKSLYDANLKAGGGLTMADAEASARRIITAEDAKKGGGGAEEEDGLEKIILAHQRRVEALGREKAALTQSTAEAARAEEAHRLLDAAKDAEIPITDDLRTKIDAMAAAYAAAKVQVDEARKSQEAFRDIQQFVGTSLTGFFSDVVSGGKNASDALMNLTKKLAEAALQAALLGQGPLANLFGTASGEKGAVGGLIGALFKGATAGGTGGTVGAGFSLSSLFGYADGGFTGAGGKHQPAGIVHAGEFVFSADAVRRLGAANLAALHGGALRGYADGGLVGVPALAAPAARGDASGPVSITIDVRGATGNAEVRQMVASGVAQGMRALNRQMARTAHTMVHDAQERYA